MKNDISTEADVRLLVDSFYRKVLADPEIGFIFTEAVPISWEKHMPVMYAFWNSILLGSSSYSGNPMLKHIELNRKVALTETHFNRWLLLWKNTAEELFSGKVADDAVKKANSLALLMQIKIRDAE